MRNDGGGDDRHHICTVYTVHTHIYVDEYFDDDNDDSNGKPNCADNGDERVKE